MNTRTARLIREAILIAHLREDSRRQWMRSQHRNIVQRYVIAIVVGRLIKKYSDKQKEAA